MQAERDDLREKLAALKRDMGQQLSEALEANKKLQERNEELETQAAAVAEDDAETERLRKKWGVLSWAVFEGNEELRARVS